MADGTKTQADDEQANRPWTVMIFMIAEHVFEWADLSKEAQTTLDAIESVTLPSWLRICVQRHTSTDVERFLKTAADHRWQKLNSSGRC